MGERGLDAKWAPLMGNLVPESSRVCDMILAECVDPAAVDLGRLRGAVSEEIWNRLRQLTEGRTDVGWDRVRAERSRSGFQLAEYLSTEGAIGLALNDKLYSFVLYTLIPRVAAEVVEGVFDRRL